jgi:hypothetical protein
MATRRMLKASVVIAVVLGAALAVTPIAPSGTRSGGEKDGRSIRGAILEVADGTHRDRTERAFKRAGAGSAVLGGLALTAPGVAHASSDDDDAMFVHIDGVVTGTEGTFKIDIDVAGTERDLRGEGWDVDPDENHSTACIFVQSGSIRRDVVELQGRVIFANDPANFAALVKTRANAEIGQIDWDFGGFLFTGRGRVVGTVAELEVD